MLLLENLAKFASLVEIFESSKKLRAGVHKNLTSHLKAAIGSNENLRTCSLCVAKLPSWSQWQLPAALKVMNTNLMLKNVIPKAVGI